MEKIIIQKGDTFEGEIPFTLKGEPFDTSDSTFIAIVKKDGQDDEEALDIAFIKSEGDKGEFELNGLDERGDYILYIKSIDGEKRFTLKEIPLTIR